MADKKVFYLKPGREHSYVKNGQVVTLTEVNSEMELNEDQAVAFADKFNEEPVNVPKPKVEAEEGVKDPGKKEEAPKAEDKPAATPAPATVAGDKK